MTAPDAFAIAMLGILTLTLATVGWMLFFILRNGNRRDKDQIEVDKLLEEVSEMVDGKEERKPLPKKRPSGPPPQEKESSSPWEKEGDWWKSE